MCNRASALRSWLFLFLVFTKNYRFIENQSTGEKPVKYRKSRKRLCSAIATEKFLKDPKYDKNQMCRYVCRYLKNREKVISAFLDT
jgi:hypothetical protein